MKNKYEKNFFSEIVKNSINLSDVAKKLGLNPGHGNRQTIKKYINLYNLNTTHFGYRNTNSNLNIINKRDLIDILIENSNYSSNHLKKRLYKEGLKERKCEKCGQGEIWNGEKISLILDHVNGNRNDNRLENLRILCPNCNAALNTHCNKNKTRYKYKIDNFCKCGKKISKGSDMCVECYSIFQRKVERPDNETLIKEINELGYTGTGRKYGVSDNAVRKWLKAVIA